ncbi:MAG TPA: hypothetical protein VGN64_20975, partial [Dyadobacter sp.]|nr:hypothetical protein [Dyadobacter sp.]
MQIISTTSVSGIEINSHIDVSQKLSLKEQETVLLSKTSDVNSRVRDSIQLDLALRIYGIVKIRLGYKAKDFVEEKAIVQVLEADLNKFPNLTEGEVLKALEMGIDGHFNPDKDIFFTSSLFVKWLRAYQAYKEPIMSKHAKLADKAELPAPQITRDERIATAAKIANGYADIRRKLPEYRVDGGGQLYVNLEEFGIYSASLAEKQEIYARLSKANPCLSDEDLRTIC